jgi:hypothetical protein
MNCSATSKIAGRNSDITFVNMVFKSLKFYNRNSEMTFYARIMPSISSEWVPSLKLYAHVSNWNMYSRRVFPNMLKNGMKNMVIHKLNRFRIWSITLDVENIFFNAENIVFRIVVKRLIPPRIADTYRFIP